MPIRVFVVCLLHALSGFHATPSLHVDPLSTEAIVRVKTSGSWNGDFPGLFARFSAYPTAKPMRARRPSQVYGCIDGDFSSSPLSSIDHFFDDAPFLLITRRGNCSFVHKALLAQWAGAAALIVVSDGEEVQVMDAGNDSAAALVQIPAVEVQKSIGDRLLGELYQEEDVFVTLTVYRPSFLDPSEGLLVLMATSLVIVGALLAAHELQDSDGSGGGASARTPLPPRLEEFIEVDGKLALGFCTMGSFMLVVLFFLMRYLVYALIGVFCIGGVTCLAGLGTALLHRRCPGLRQQALTLPPFGAFAYSEILPMIPAMFVVSAWLMLRNTTYGWIFQDIIGAGFLCMLQRTLRLPSLKVATLLLSAMFFFDIFWVFISPVFFKSSVMVTVATGGGTGESIPMLLRVPAIGDVLAQDRMLGFGDVALPGLLVTFLRRQDLLARRTLCKGYFVPAVAGYAIGLCITIVALMWMRKGQPALLYLVPCTLGLTIALARMRGDLRDMWRGDVDHRGSAATAGTGTAELSGTTSVAETA
eukprot:TRINITY_DN2062_c0_g1_i1.p1 TRINITY_DN2062_c0_g1~~TRINITY_DN2062_c0_g1_i1.p1  ORF type:complete len:531 (+),score=86.90 TRINITY_DN2062_c0_g1_i1:55-1647(+)